MYLQVRHAQNLCDATGFEIDVHWHLCSRRWTLADDDADFWAESRPVTFRHVACRALAPTDLLFHVCLHATKWNSPDPGVLWVADASRIVRRCGDTIDWARLVAHAQRRGFGRPLGDALSYLRETVELPIPAEPLRALNGAWSSRIERLQYRMERRRPGPVTGFVLLGLWYRSYARSQPDRSPSRRLARLVEFLRCRWGTASVWKALPYLLAKLLRSWWPLPSRRPPDAGVWHERLTSMALRPPDAP
jgi:hypothetical protein